MKYVYKVENIITGEFYIGKTSNLMQRMESHQKRSSNKNLRHSMKDYGKENHIFHILHCGSDSDEYISMCEAYEIDLNKDNGNMMNIQLENIVTSSAWIHPKIKSLRYFRDSVKEYWEDRYCELVRKERGKIGSIIIPQNKEYIKQCVLSGEVGNGRSFNRAFGYEHESKTLDIEGCVDGYGDVLDPSWGRRRRSHI
tara:strand:- start:178 stop:768 length:591 start_codon:yes stop_codon:yes gene_type:complete